MIELMNTWDKNNEHTAWIIRHACRTLIKKGHPASLAIFDFEKNVKIEILNFKILNPKIKLGDTLQFEFAIVSQKATSQKLVVDYKIHYIKKSGEQLPKTFKLKDVELKGKQTVPVSKSHRFLDFSTRKHYAGKHAVEIMINGKSMARKEFYLAV